MTQTEEISSVIRTQLIPLADMNMLLPNTCIAEVIALGDLTPVEKSPDWFLSMMNWRGVSRTQNTAGAITPVSTWPRCGMRMSGMNSPTGGVRASSGGIQPRKRSGVICNS